MPRRSAAKHTTQPVTTDALRPWSPPVQIWSAEHGKPTHFMLELPGVSRDSLKARLEGHRLTVTGERRTINPDKAPPVIINELGRAQASLAPQIECQPFTCVFAFPATVIASRVQARYDPIKQTLSIEAQDEIDEIVALRGTPNFIDGSEPFPIDIAASPRDIEAEIDRRRMLDYGKSFVQDGVRYFPLSAAAPVVQAPASTILHWIKHEKKFDGEPLQSYYFAPANQYFISEESIARAADRFIKWPTQEPTGPVTLGDQRDQSGYIGLTDAAQTLGVDHHTMWRWATKGTAPIKPLDVIKCPASDQYYIRQKDITALKKHVPRSGLRAGRRRHSAPHPN